MTYDLAIVGAGYWGVAAALLADRAGVRTVLIDDARFGRASAVASGYFSERWYKGSWRPLIDRAFDDARAVGVNAERPGNEVHGARPHVLGDWWMLWPEQYLGLRKVDVPSAVVVLRPGYVATENEQEISAKKILVAAGAWTDDLLMMNGLRTIGVMGLGGTGVLYDGVAPPRVVLHQLSVFKQYAIRPWTEGRVRIGETVETKPARHRDYVASMERTMAPYVRRYNLRRVGEVFGLRPVVKQGMVVESVGEGIWAASGGGRVGAIPAFWAAREFLKQAGFQ